MRIAGLRPRPVSPRKHLRPIALLSSSLWLVAAALSPRSAGAQEEVRARDVRLTIRGGSAAWDVGYVALAGGAFVIGSLAIPPRIAEVAPLDGLGHRDRDEAFELASDATLVGGLLMGASLGFVFESSAGRRGFEALRAPLVLSEGALAASGVVHLVKNVFGVCRPRDWNEAERVCTDVGERGQTERGRFFESRRSFPSGHTAPLAGMAGASFGLWLIPSGTRREFLPLALTQGAFAVAIVGLRPAAGAHSWVDTGTAFTVGLAMGLLTAALHAGPGKPEQPGAGGQLGVQQASAAPQVSLGGAF